MSPVSIGSVPKHEHDCSTCTYIGSQVGTHGQTDIYVCPQSGHPTVICRWGDEGPEYMSGADIANDLREPLRSQALALLDDLRRKGKSS